MVRLRKILPKSDKILTPRPSVFKHFILSQLSNSIDKKFVFPGLAPNLLPSPSILDVRVAANNRRSTDHGPGFCQEADSTWRPALERTNDPGRGFDHFLDSLPRFGFLSTLAPGILLTTGSSHPFPTCMREAASFPFPPSRGPSFTGMTQTWDFCINPPPLDGRGTAAHKTGSPARNTGPSLSPSLR